MNAFRWGIFGTGEVARKFALGLRSVPGAEAAWIASREEGRAAALARRVGVGRGIGGYEAAAREGADAIYIATPAALHAEHALACLAARTPVLVEKPFAADAASARRIAEAARAAGVFCMEAMWTRFLPALEAARAALAAGEIGTPRLLTAEFCIASARAGAPGLFDPAPGAGALFQRGVYPFSLAVHLLGWPERVEGVARLGENGIDEECALTLVHPGGALSQLRASLTATGTNGLEILGDAGALAFAGPIWRPFGIRLRRFAPRGGGGGGGKLADLRESGLAQRLQQRLSALRAPRWTLRRAPCDGNGYGHEAAELMARVRAGERESPLMPLDESVRVVAALDALREGWSAP